MIDSTGACKEPPAIVPTINPTTGEPNDKYGYVSGSSLPCARLALPPGPAPQRQPATDAAQWPTKSVYQPAAPRNAPVPPDFGRRRATASFLRLPPASGCNSYGARALRGAANEHVTYRVVC